MHLEAARAWVGSGCAIAQIASTVYERGFLIVGMMLRRLMVAGDGGRSTGVRSLIQTIIYLRRCGIIDGGRLTPGRVSGNRRVSSVHVWLRLWLR